MTAKKLIEFLQTVPPEMPVFVEGYEGGATPPSRVYVDTFTDEGTARPEYYGRYEPDDGGPITAVYLTR